MTFTEKPVLSDERRPLLRDPVWSHGHRYGRGRMYDQEEMEELLGIDRAKNQKFRMMLFICVTFVSVLILFATMGILIKLSHNHPLDVSPSPNTTPFPVTFSILPQNSSQSPVDSTIKDNANIAATTIEAISPSSLGSG